MVADSTAAGGVGGNRRVDSHLVVAAQAVLLLSVAGAAQLIEVHMHTPAGAIVLKIGYT